MISILIDNGIQIFQPIVEDKICWSLQRLGAPGKLTFSVLQDEVLNFSEGSKVCLHVDGNALFYGFVFERSCGKDKVIEVTAYDQLRYLKNKDSYNYENLSVKEVIEMIAQDFHLDVGILEDTEYKIPFRSEPDKTLFDIILTALDLTMIYTKKMYTFFDDYGKLTLKSQESMKLDTVITSIGAKDYDYSSSIDGETYNQIKVSIDNQETGKKDIFISKDSGNINLWGVLQYYYKADSHVINGQELADSYLTKHNRKTKKLSIKDALGNIQVRAGSLIPVYLDTVDDKICNYMLVEKVNHTFTGNLHTMDMTLRGGDFNV